MQVLRKLISDHLKARFSERGKYSHIYTDIEGQEELTIKVYEQRLPDIMDDKYSGAPFILITGETESETVNVSEEFQKTVAFTLTATIPCSKKNDVVFDDDLRLENLVADVVRELKSAVGLQFAPGTTINTEYGNLTYGTQAIAAQITFSAQISGTYDSNLGKYLKR